MIYKKKILFVSGNDHVEWGGSEVLWSQTALNLVQKENFEIAFCVKRWPETPEHLQKLIDAGCIDLRWDLPGKVKRTLQRRMLDRVLKRNNKRTVSIHYSLKALERYDPSLVVISMGDHNWGYRWMNELCKRGVDYILLPQLVKDAMVPDENTNQYKFLKQGYLNAKYVCCVSYDNLKLLEKQFAHTFENVKIVNNPIHHPEYTIEYPSCEVYHLACVASLNLNHKAQDIILELMRIDKWQRRNIQIHLYGNGPHRRILQRLIDKWTLKNVMIEPFTEIERIWAKNHMLLLPSRMEGLSLALLEALNFERMVLTTNLGDASRFIDNGISGFLLEYPTVKLLDEKMEEAWEKRAQWKEMGKLGKKKLLNIIKVDPVQSFSEFLIRV